MKVVGGPSAGRIAEIAGVSKSTVSRALSGHPSISEGTRKRILKIAHEIGYEPNAMASSLVTARSGVIGFVIGEMENPFYQEHIEKVARISAAAGTQLMLFQVPQDGELADVVPAMARYRLEGCIVIASVRTNAKSLTACRLHGIPVVLINRVVHDGSASSVLCHNEAGGHELGRFLLAGGHRRIAIISGRADSIVNRDRLTGFRAALAEAGVREVAEVNGDFRFEAAYQAARELLSAEPRCDAIFAVSDLMACGAIDAARDLAVRVPDDLSIVGFDGIRTAAWPAYRLTTVAQPADAILSRAVALIAARDPNRAPEISYINGLLKVRRSARVPAGYAPEPEYL
ncbi:LacI family DNA-binding transcriptional regulator [Cereibacter azotoformans]|uniref:LacI family transcriptional regulator n=1 Tax=Cereibacter azotoformans TaxID=43057 RepID=A0A2T5KDA5_9RHOB|nr:LacI family DNA-binding transcriptional regulator [Cereibacter azotoformans]AXQ93564.1 LacI family DNA-binding transcriptional regulator [Cereibacter sphaeroides]MBO4168668.1 LacI family DNA-binding transcriptional regulator [Cereibacter azotoformans]PTR20342.1 LacI family transcriptional regulator [Cereibacter azotoformans]UIJ31902.1 LacI family DNA-binding transcriptional regulator [Cereibacter azotoformans]